jgi:hypothetical protein
MKFRARCSGVAQKSLSRLRGTCPAEDASSTGLCRWAPQAVQPHFAGASDPYENLKNDRKRKIHRPETNLNVDVLMESRQTIATIKEQHVITLGKLTLSSRR